MVPWKEKFNVCCDAVRQIIDPIHAVVGKKHPCNKKHNPYFYSSDRLNQYIRSIIPNNMPVPPQSFLKRKEPYRICNNLHKRIIKKLGPTIDANLINKEEELLKKKSRYNLRSLDLDQIKFLVDDNQCIVIEEEEEEATDPPTPTPIYPVTPTPTNHRSKPRKGSSVTFPGLIAGLKNGTKNNLRN